MVPFNNFTFIFQRGLSSLFLSRRRSSHLKNLNQFEIMI
jgi:hypothetical protein